MRLSGLILSLTIAAVLPAQAAGLTLADLAPAKGDRQVYKVTEESSMTFEGTPVKMSSKGAGTQTSEVVALSKGKAATVYLVLASHTITRTRTPGSSKDTTTSYSLDACRAAPSGLYLDANIGFEDSKDDSVEIGGTLLEIRLPCQPGTSWRVGRLTYKDGFTVRPTAEAVGYETVQVPAGTFENCLKVVSTCPNGIEGYLNQEGQRLEIISGEIQVVTWYAPRVGEVKERSTVWLRLQPEGKEDAATLRMDTTTVTELTEHTTGTR